MGILYHHLTAECVSIMQTAEKTDQDRFVIFRAGIHHELLRVFDLAA